MNEADLPRTGNAVELSIVITTWNTRDILVDCLESILRHSPSRSFEIIVIDNASADSTVDSVARAFPQVLVIANSVNRGFAAANNQGIQKASGRYLLLLNPDTILHSRSLDILCEFMDGHEDVAACGPRLLNSDGTLQRSTRRFPTFRAILYRYTALRYLGLFRRDYLRWMMRDFAYDRQMDVDQIMGSALMLRRSFIGRVGMLDERFFMYCEEVDLCYRIRQAGGRIVFVPDSVITHLGGQSSRQVPVGRYVMALASQLRYFRKHRSRFAVALFNGVFKPGFLFRSLCQAVSGTLLYTAASLTRNRARRARSAVTIRTSIALLARHSWWLLFKA